jgi:hypothetical protein
MLTEQAHIYAPAFVDVAAAAAAGQMYGIYVCWCLAATAANSLGDKVNIRMNVSGWVL